MKNTGKDYESLVEQVFVQLMEQDSVKNISVERNKTLQGKTTTHEIDVFWEFIVGGIQYSTIIQAKDWTQKVPQGEMLKLKGILDDLPSQPRAVFVTKTGYQSGAIDVAKANGIILYEFREPTDNDWEGRIKTIVITMKAFVPNTKVSIVPDEEWIQSELKRLNVKEINVSISGMENEIYIMNEDGSKWKSMYEIKEEEQKKIGIEKVSNKEVKVEYDGVKYINIDNQDIPRVKIRNILVSLSNGVIEQTTELDGSTMVGYILKNLIDGSEVTFDKDAIIRK